MLEFQLLSQGQEEEKRLAVEAVRKFLEPIRMLRYANKFLKNGFDRIDIIQSKMPFPR